MLSKTNELLIKDVIGAVDLKLSSTEDLISALKFITQGKVVATKQEDKIKAILAERYGDLIREELNKKDEPFGVVNLDVGSDVVKFTQPKDVEWDQSGLSKLYDRLKNSVDNVDDYIDVKYAVPEGKYKAWPQELKDQFIDCRTVKPKKIVVKIEEKE